MTAASLNFVPSSRCSAAPISALSVLTSATSGSRLACSARTASSLCCASTICAANPSHCALSVSSSARRASCSSSLRSTSALSVLSPFEPALELLDERYARADARDLRVELGDRLVQPRRLLRPFIDQLQLAEDRVHLGLELRRRRRERRHALAERLQPDAIGAELVGQLRRLGVRLVELLDLAAQGVEILAALAERVELPRGLLREVVDVAEPLVERLERELLLRQVVGRHEQRLDALGHAVDLLGQLDEALVPGGQRFHARLGVADAGVQRPQAQVERLELLLLQRERVHLAADGVEQRSRFLLQLAGLVLGLDLQLGGGLELGVGLGGQLLGARERVVCPRNLLHALVQLADLHVHRPDHLVHAVGLHDGVLDRLLLRVERLGLVRDVLGERVERGQPLFGALAQFVETRQRPQLVLDFLDRRQRRGRVFARLARGLANLGVVVGQGGGDRADLFQLRLERVGLAERLLDLDIRLLQLDAELFERRRVPSSTCRASPACRAPATTDAERPRDASAARRPGPAPSASSARPVSPTRSATGCACRAPSVPWCDRRAPSGAWRSRRGAR